MGLANTIASWLNVPEEQVWNAYLVAIDFEGRMFVPTEVGLSITQLRKPSEDYTLRLDAMLPINEITEVQAFINRSGRPSRQQRRYALSHKDVQTSCIMRSQLGMELRDLIVRLIKQRTSSDASSDSQPPRIIFVAHDLGTEKKTLERFGFDFGEEALFLGWIDTQVIARKHFDAGYSVGLGNLLEQLGFSLLKLFEHGLAPTKRHFHDACDGAHYAMCALLLLAVHWEQPAGNLCLIGPEANWMAALTCTPAAAFKAMASRSDTAGVRPVFDVLSTSGPVDEGCVATFVALTKLTTPYLLAAATLAMSTACSTAASENGALITGGCLSQLLEYGDALAGEAFREALTHLVTLATFLPAMHAEKQAQKLLVKPKQDTMFMEGAIDELFCEELARL